MRHGVVAVCKVTENNYVKVITNHCTFYKEDFMKPTDITRKTIEDVVNHLYEATGAATFFEPPTVKFASADDRWFTEFKTIINPEHWTPQEALNLLYPEATAKTVISFCCPNSREAREGNRKETERPCELWARIRSFGDQALQNMRNQLARWLQEHGVAAVAPFQQDDYKLAVKNLRSRWSERHVAFVTGMGTFGLSGGLITEHGVAHRLASVVTSLELSPDVRPYGDDYTAWCTKCGACRRRCPAGSIGNTLAERDKTKCKEYQMKTIVPNRADTYGWMDFGIGCGLCQTAVPCEDKRP